MKRLFFVFLLLSLLLAVSVSAVTSFPLSPGLRHLAEETCMIRSGITGGEITFTPDDFERAVGCSFESITITALPPASEGTLYYGTIPAAVNQVLRASSLSSLRFVPSPSSADSSFRFKADGDYSIACLLRTTDTGNLPPVIAPSDTVIPVWTQENITTYGMLNGSDPEGDTVTYEIVRYPENGIVEITDTSSGSYRYTPCAGVHGEDSFVYIMRDCWGNYSKEATVVIDIDKAASQLVLSDMEGHWAHNAALVMVSDGSMEAKSVDGQLCFNPDDAITREDFLVTVMKTLGAGEIEPSITVFADDNMISTEASGYITRAYELGIIRGSEENGLLCFKPQQEITRAEAAVILNAIIGADEPDTVPVFADNSAVPAWAKASLYALSDAGILQGTGAGNLSPNEYLSRAQTAQILLSVKKIYG